VRCGGGATGDGRGRRRVMGWPGLLACVRFRVGDACGSVGMRKQKIGVGGGGGGGDVRPRAGEFGRFDHITPGAHCNGNQDSVGCKAEVRVARRMHAKPALSTGVPDGHGCPSMLPYKFHTVFGMHRVVVLTVHHSLNYSFDTHSIFFWCERRSFGR
jgi:hypothetical protein